MSLTRKQEQIYLYLQEHADSFPHAPSLDELCNALGLKSRGSLHKHIQALIDEGLVEPMNHKQRGIRLTEQQPQWDQANDSAYQLPLMGYIAAGKPLEAISEPVSVSVPPQLHTGKNCFVLQIQGDSMIDEGILDGDWVIIEPRQTARNGEIVVAMIDNSEVTLKRIEQNQQEIILHPANSKHSPMRYEHSRVSIQGVLVGQMRSY